jgi:hypothetical protein
MLNASLLSAGAGSSQSLQVHEVRVLFPSFSSSVPDLPPPTSGKVILGAGSPRYQ